MQREQARGFPELEYAVQKITRRVLPRESQLVRRHEKGRVLAVFRGLSLNEAVGPVLLERPDVKSSGWTDDF